MTYLITFSCYGSHLHGDRRGSIDRAHNQAGAPVRSHEPALERFEAGEMLETAYLLDQPAREIVLRSIIDVCAYRGWDLIAAHVRENHVHAIMAAESPPERIVRDLKAYSSRALKHSGRNVVRRKRWTRYASMRSLPGRQACERAIKYVVNGQGSPMAVYLAHAH